MFVILLTAAGREREARASFRAGHLYSVWRWIVRNGWNRGKWLKLWELLGGLRSFLEDEGRQGSLVKQCINYR